MEYDAFSREDVIAAIGQPDNDAVVIIDEAYHYFCPSTFIDLTQTYDNVIVMRTFSKLFSLAACRLGVIISNPQGIHSVNNTRPTFDVNALALLFGEKILDHPELIDELVAAEREGRFWTIDTLRERGWEARPSEGNFIFVRTHRPAGEVAADLEARGILVKSWGSGMLKDYLRISTGSKAAMEKARRRPDGRGRRLRPHHPKARIPVKKVITYGTFDLLHRGHVNLLRRAKELGDYLIVGVTSSDFDKNRGKINVKQSLMDRIEAVKALGIADEVIPEEYYGQKIDDIRNYDVDIFAIGSDWRGHFDYLNEYCEVVYLDRTEGISSTQLREDRNHISLGIVGASRDIAKFIDESKYVSGVDVVAVFPDGDDFDLADRVPLVATLEALLAESDAVYVANAPARRYQTARAALEAGKHVLSESPVALAAKEARSLFELARKRELVFHEAIKTAYALAFSRLTLLIKSGMIGTPVSVRATCTSQSFKSPAGSPHRLGAHRQPAGCSRSWAPTTSASAASLTSREDGTDVYTKVDFIYDSACATFEVGSGVKSEGSWSSPHQGLRIRARPWWKTDYYEVRFGDSPATSATSTS